MGEPRKPIQGLLDFGSRTQIAVLEPGSQELSIQGLSVAASARILLDRRDAGSP